MLRRLFRIYPAYLVCILIYYIYSCSHLSLHDFLVNTLTNKYYILQEILLIRENHNLYLPGWSLGIEIALSAFLPFLVLLFKYVKKLFAAFTIVALILNKHYISIFTLPEKTVLSFCMNGRQRRYNGGRSGMGLRVY